MLKSGDETSEENDVKQLPRYSRPEWARGRRWEESGIFGHENAAAEGGVDVSEVVLQRCDLLRVLLRGEDLRGELSQLRGKKPASQEALVVLQLGWDRTDRPVTRRCGRGPHTESTPPPESRVEW